MDALPSSLKVKAYTCTVLYVPADYLVSREESQTHHGERSFRRETQPVVQGAVLMSGAGVGARRRRVVREPSSEVEEAAVPKASEQTARDVSGAGARRCKLVDLRPRSFDRRVRVRHCK